MSLAAPLGRGPRVRAAVLAAAVEELSKHGYSAFTVDNVATEIPIPDSGSVEDDLHAPARSLVA